MSPSAEGDDKAPRIRVELTVKGALVAIAAAAAVWLFLEIWQVLLVVVVALMLVGTLNPYVERLEGRGLPRSHSIVVVFGALFIVGAVTAALMIPQLITQVTEVVDGFPALQARAVGQLEAWRLTGLAVRVRSLHGTVLSEKAAEYGVSYWRRATEIVAYGVSSFFLALYLIIDRDRMRGAVFAVVPRAYHVRLSRVLMNLETIVGGYMRGQAITSALMTAFTFVVLASARVPRALALAILAGLVDVLPYVGGLLACTTGFVAALPRGSTVALIVLALLAAYGEFESRVLVPRVYGSVLRLPSAVVLIALLIGGKLLGILGALLALPIAAGLRMVVEELRLELPGEDVDDSSVRAKDAEAEAEFESRAAGVPAQEAATIAAEIAHERQLAETADPAVAAEVPITAGKERREL